MGSRTSLPGPQLSHRKLSDSGRVPDPPRTISVLLRLPARHSTAVGSLQAPGYRDPSDAGSPAVSGDRWVAPFLPELSCALQSRKAALSRFAVAGGSPTSLFHTQVPPFSSLLPGLGSALLICADAEDGHSIKIVKHTPHEPGVHMKIFSVSAGSPPPAVLIILHSSVQSLLINFKNQAH